MVAEAQAEQKQPASPSDEDIVRSAEAKAAAALPNAIAERESREQALRQQEEQRALQQEALLEQQRQAQEAAVAQAMALAQQAMHEQEQEEQEAKMDEVPPAQEDEDFGEALEAALNAMHEEGGINADELELLTEEIFEAEDVADTVVGQAFAACRDDPTAFKRKIRMIFKKARGGGKAD